MNFFTAGHTKLLESHSRLSSNIIDNPTKLDVHQRNTYNRTNHNRQPKIVVATEPLPTPLTTSAIYDHHRFPPNEPDPYWGDEQADNRKFTERRKKTVRFDGQDGSDDWGRWDSERQGSQDSATKDSGIDTSSTFTSSEDSNRGDGPKVFHQITKKKKTLLCLNVVQV